MDSTRVFRRSDLHCGVFGRTVPEPMTGPFALMARLVNPAGDILVAGIDDVVFVADAKHTDVDSAAGAPIALSANKTHVIMGSRRSTVIP
ncbi:hypothetical protein B0H11DRAFT_2225702 [Mycena galericulata]|nr:hypothetical protein B0H11DRAFT_2225702 [Mycena galericulata]